jgi:hypothetical protein
VPPLNIVLTIRTQSQTADLVLIAAHRSGMVRHLLILLPIGLVISGCASAPPPSCGPIAWQGSGQALYKPAPRKSRLTEGSLPTIETNVDRDLPKADSDTATEQELANLPLHSAAWWAMREQIDAEDQRRLTAKLVICRGCLPVPSDRADHTGSTKSPTNATRDPSCNGLGCKRATHGAGL